MVPLDDQHTVLDWMMALNVPLVVVTGTYLGTLSHTLTCLDVLKRRELAIKALVVNETPGSSVPLADTMATAEVLRAIDPDRRPEAQARRRTRSRRSPIYFDSMSRSVASTIRVAAFRSDSLMCSLAAWALASRMERGPAP